MHKETSVKDEFRSMVTTELVATSPRQIEEFLQRYMQTHAIAFQSCVSTPIPTLQEKLYKAMKDSLDVQAAELLRTSIQLYKESNCLGKRKEELIPQIPEKEARIFFDPQRDQNGPPRFFMEQGFVFLKNGNTKAKKYDLSLHKIHATPFPEDDLEELLTRWVGKVLKRFDEEARLSIQHWKNTWAKISYRKNHRKIRSDPEEVCSNLKIIEAIRVKNEETHGQDFMDEIVINITAPTLIIPDIEELEPYTIITDPFIGIVYENSKKERRVMNIDELPKFCGAMLTRVLKKVEEILLAACYGFRDPPLSEEHKEVMGFFEEEVKERLKLRRQIRRWESFVKGRQLLSLRDRPKYSTLKGRLLRIKKVFINLRKWSLYLIVTLSIK
ncbi:hypothetical protein Tco_0038508 [Tanacetum coccineum]